MKKRLISVLIVLNMAVCLLSFSGCINEEKNTSASIDEPGISESEPTSFESEATSFEQNSESDNSQATPVVVELSNTYTTKFREVNAIEYPSFSFDYPNGWTVTEETVTQQSELVKLTNDRGATVIFSYIGEKDPGGGSATVMSRVEVSKIANSDFIPAYVQATSYADLGTFMVAGLKPTGTMDMKADTDYTEIDGNVSYAVVPETYIGTHIGLRKDYILDFSFWYAGNVALIAYAPKDGFTEQEEQEVIAMLASFRVDDGLIYDEDGNIIGSVVFGDDGVS